MKSAFATGMEKKWGQGWRVKRLHKGEATVFPLERGKILILEKEGGEGQRKNIGGEALSFLPVGERQASVVEGCGNGRRSLEEGRAEDGLTL